MVQNFTVNDLTKKLRKEMRKSELLSKAREGSPKREPRQKWSVPKGKVTEMWQAGGKMKFIYLPPGYGNDPLMLRHSAGCSFYQGSCVTQDLWIQNLRSTGI
jgi:hypothetical protein